jgi:isoaspartyl peptidase/L-asparaginase-like protein (Ntn-hydrolase superfamily)
MISCGIVIHGGVGSSPRLTSACKAICERAFSILKEGGPALEAVTEAVRLLEDDGRFNAGSGSSLRLDGRTVEMDAGVMDSEGRIGMVMALRNVRNPILVARAVTETPHVALAGQGATLFARQRGLAPSPPVSERALIQHREIQRLIREGRLEERDGRWRGSDMSRLWNFEVAYGEVPPPDTVGAVAIDRSGGVAAAASTGGAPPMMLGRVGDTALVGSGLYAAYGAAVTVTGMGEEIIRRMLSKTVYDLIRSGQETETACGEGLALFPPEMATGIIAISAGGYAIRANRRMAAYSLIEEV